MNNVLKAKLIKRLRSALCSNLRPINADALKAILIDIRDLLELLGESDRYKVLKFHCDWILHSRLTGPRVQKIIRAVDAECVKSVTKAGLQEWPDSLGSDFFGPVSQDYMNEALSRFTFHHFESELRLFLERNHIAKLAELSSGTYRDFEIIYCQLIEDRTWDYTNKKEPTRYVNRVRVRMLRRANSMPAPAGSEVFPFSLWWVFLWNDEERVKLEVEFLSKRPGRTV